MSSRTVYRIVWVPSLAALIGILGFLPAKVTVAAKPAAMVTMQTRDGLFQIDHPSNWKPLETNAHDVAPGVVMPIRKPFIAITRSFSGLSSEMPRWRAMSARIAIGAWK